MSPQLLRETKPTARKPHLCDLCGSAITPGDTYTRATLVNDGAIYDWRECSACVTDRIGSRVQDWCLCDSTGPDCAAEWAAEMLLCATNYDELGVAKRYLERRAS